MRLDENDKHKNETSSLLYSYSLRSAEKLYGVCAVCAY